MRNVCLLKWFAGKWLERELCGSSDAFVTSRMEAAKAVGRSETLIPLRTMIGLLKPPFGHMSPIGHGFIIRSADTK